MHSPRADPPNIYLSIAYANVADLENKRLYLRDEKSKVQISWFHIQNSQYWMGTKKTCQRPSDTCLSLLYEPAFSVHLHMF